MVRGGCAGPLECVHRRVGGLNAGGLRPPAPSLDTFELRKCGVVRCPTGVPFTSVVEPHPRRVPPRHEGAGWGRASPQHHVHSG
jgi:hypothetical protein